jgi:hypothetical protein
VNKEIIQRLKRLPHDPRFVLCLCSVLVWWLVLPSQPGCYLVYLATPWGQASVIFMAALLLWIRHPLPRLISIALSLFMLYGATVSIGHGWDNFKLMNQNPALWENELKNPRLMLLKLIWPELIVSALATCVAAYALKALIRKTTERPSALP